MLLIVLDVKPVRRNGPHGQSCEAMTGSGVLITRELQKKLTPVHPARLVPKNITVQVFYINHTFLKNTPLGVFFNANSINLRLSVCPFVGIRWR